MGASGNSWKYVDSQYGTGGTPTTSVGTGIKVNVPVIYDTKYFRKSQTKTWFNQNGMIGAMSYASGNIELSDQASPVVRLTDFQGKKGDTMILHQQEWIADTVNSGIAGTGMLVDSETYPDTNYQKVKIEQWRQGVRTDAGMNVQRNPYDKPLEEIEAETLSNWTASVMDTGLVYAMHYGHAPHLMRVYGVTNQADTACYHTLFGNDSTWDVTRTIANIAGDATDNISTKTFEIAYGYAKQNNFDMLPGDYLAALLSPKAIFMLYQDEKFRDAVSLARERGIDNPLFKNTGALLYHNCLIFSYDKIRSIIGGYNPAGLSITNAGAYNSSITEAAYTGIGGSVAYTDLHQTYFLGARALILAEGRMRMAERKEDDYGQIIGRAADNIWGAKRNDWINNAAVADNYANQICIVNTILN